MQFLRRPDHPTSRQATDLQALLRPKRHIDQQILNGLTAPRKDPAELWSTNCFKAPRCKSQSWRLSLHTFGDCHSSVGKMSCSRTLCDIYRQGRSEVQQSIETSRVTRRIHCTSYLTKCWPMTPSSRINFPTQEKAAAVNCKNEFPGTVFVDLFHCQSG